MIEAELNGKIGVDGHFANERMEDVLTSNVFGLLRYLPAEAGILRWLSLATSMGKGESLTAVGAPELHFWPRLGVGEVDLMAVLPVSPTHVDLVAIECKYLSGKSGCAADAPAGQESAYDQLAKYALALQGGEFDWDRIVGVRVVRRSVILYVTADAAAPMAELNESLRVLGTSGWRDRFFWVGWDALCGPLRSIEGEPSLSAIVAGDLRRLLEHKGLRPFEGFGTLCAPSAPSVPSWRLRWSGLSDLALDATRGWRARWSVRPPAVPSVTKSAFRRL